MGSGRTATAVDQYRPEVFQQLASAAIEMKRSGKTIPLLIRHSLLALRLGNPLQARQSALEAHSLAKSASVGEKEAAYACALAMAMEGLCLSGHMGHAVGVAIPTAPTRAMQEKLALEMLDLASSHAREVGDDDSTRLWHACVDAHLDILEGKIEGPMALAKLVTELITDGL